MSYITINLMRKKDSTSFVSNCHSPLRMLHIFILRIFVWILKRKIQDATARYKELIFKIVFEMKVDYPIIHFDLKILI